jgi:hypothetical protein
MGSLFFCHHCISASSLTCCRMKARVNLLSEFCFRVTIVLQLLIHDLLSVLTKDAKLVARAQGGNNAGHTIVCPKSHTRTWISSRAAMLTFHSPIMARVTIFTFVSTPQLTPHSKRTFAYFVSSVPSGLMSPTCQNLIGTGVVVHIPSFFKELVDLEEQGLENVRERIFISVSKSDSTGSEVTMLTQTQDRCHVSLDVHSLVDGLEEVCSRRSFLSILNCWKSYETLVYSLTYLASSGSLRSSTKTKIYIGWAWKGQYWHDKARHRPNLLDKGSSK